MVNSNCYMKDKRILDYLFTGSVFSQKSIAFHVLAVVLLQIATLVLFVNFTIQYRYLALYCEN